MSELNTHRVNHSSHSPNTIDVLILRLLLLCQQFGEEIRFAYPPFYHIIRRKCLDIDARSLPVIDTGSLHFHIPVGALLVYLNRFSVVTSSFLISLMLYINNLYLAMFMNISCIKVRNILHTCLQKEGIKSVHLCSATR